MHIFWIIIFCIHFLFVSLYIKHNSPPSICCVAHWLAFVAIGHRYPMLFRCKSVQWTCKMHICTVGKFIFFMCTCTMGDGRFSQLLMRDYIFELRIVHTIFILNCLNIDFGSRLLCRQNCAELFALWQIITKIEAQKSNKLTLLL